MKAARFVVTLALALGYAPFALAADPPPNIGSFEIHPSRDPMNDADTSAIVTIDNTSHYGLEQLLGWQCVENRLEVHYIWGKYLEGDDESLIAVEMRFDAGEASPPTRFEITANHKGGYLNQQYVKGITRFTLRSRTLTLRVTDEDGERIAGRFDLTGLSRALATLPCAAGVR